jgi:uncharacterized tellurite resistance protein B-like protein
MQEAGKNRRTETLDYMQSMLGQLRTMAEAERYDLLAYLIEMAYVEAGDIARGDRPARIGIGQSEQQTTGRSD